MANGGFCPRCGTPVQLGASFCVNCGTAVGTPAPSTATGPPAGPPPRASGPPAGAPPRASWPPAGPPPAAGPLPPAASPPPPAASPPPRTNRAFPRWLPVAAIAAVAAVVIFLATRGGDDKDTVASGTTIATNSANSPEGVFRAFTDAVIAGRCTEAQQLVDTATRRLAEALDLNVCEVLEDDAPTSYRIDGVKMLDSNRARVDNTSTLRSGATNSDPNYAVNDSGTWKFTFEYLEADAAAKAATGNSPFAVTKAFYDALIAGRCDEARSHLDTETRARFQRKQQDICPIEVRSYTISGVFFVGPDMAYVFVVFPGGDNVMNSIPHVSTREGGTWKLAFDV